VINMAKRKVESPASEGFDNAIKALGAEVLPFSAFLNSGGAWVVRVTNEDFLKEVGLALNSREKKLTFSKTTLLGTDKTEFFSSFNQVVLVRKKINDYYLVGVDGMTITTTVV